LLRTHHQLSGTSNSIVAIHGLHFCSSWFRGDLWQSEMVQYKLTYFNGRGRAELSRLIFAAAGVQYEDIRYDHDRWPTIQPSEMLFSINRKFFIALCCHSSPVLISWDKYATPARSSANLTPSANDKHQFFSRCLIINMLARLCPITEWNTWSCSFSRTPVKRTKSIWERQFRQQKHCSTVDRSQLSM
jgi:hypothetical protein